MFKIFKKTIKIADLINYIQSNKLNLSPYYQRSGQVWSKSKKQDLIDSILNEIDLPKFYFHFYPEDENGKFDYAVIDGKQRILAIMGFVKNEFRLKDSFIFLNGITEIQVNGMSFNEIQEQYPSLAAKFMLFELDVVYIDSDEIERINEMFIRINAGTPVNNAEKRNALGGILMKEIGRICSMHPFFQSSISFRNSRNAYQEILLKLFVIEYKQEIVNLNNTNIEQVLKNCKDCKNQELEILQCIQDILSYMVSVFGTQNRILKNNNIVTYYCFLKDKSSEVDTVKRFIESFERERRNTIDRTDEKVFLYWKYNELVKQGTYQKRSIEERINILQILYSDYKSGL